MSQSDSDLHPCLTNYTNWVLLQELRFSHLFGSFYYQTLVLCIKIIILFSFVVLSQNLVYEALQ